MPTNGAVRQLTDKDLIMNKTFLWMHHFEAILSFANGLQINLCMHVCISHFFLCLLHASAEPSTCA